MKKLRVGYFVSTTFMGGMERHILMLIDKLDPEQRDATVFCAYSEWLAPFFEELKARKVSLYTTRGQGQGHSKIPENEDPRASWMRVFRWILRRLSPDESLRQAAIEAPWIFSVRAKLAAAKLDVIHFHAGRLMPLYWPLIASRLVRIPVRILTLHNAAKKRLPFVRALERVALRSVHCVVAPSDYIQQSLLNDKRVLPQKVVVIPHGIELSEAGDAIGRTEARRKLDLPVDAPIVGMVGRLVYLKGPDLLIRAAPAIRASVPGVKIVLIGEGPEENALRRLADRQGVSDVVAFIGYRPDARQLLQALDVLAVPSRDEGFSLSTIEAMACGKPVVATNVGGIPHVVVDSVTGLLTPPENAAALAGALIRLLTNPKESEAMGRAGRERVRARFHMDTMLFETFSMYDAPSPSFPRPESVGENSG